MKTVINVVSGFLGAGKTTLIKKLLKDGLNGEKIVLIENEYGEIGIDGGFLKEAGVQITEMNSDCICCTLVGDFGRALEEVLEKYEPERILIEPSGVGKLSDVVKAVQNVADKMEGVVVGGSVTVADVLKCKMYMKNFGEFYNNQIETAGTIVLSRTQKASEDKVEECVAMLRERNAAATIITTPWDELEGAKILETMQAGSSFEQQVIASMVFEDEDEDDDDDDDDDDHDEHEHHHDHDHDHEEHEHEHHHDHDDDDDDHDHDEHDHEDDDHDHDHVDHDHEEHEHHHHHHDEHGHHHHHHHHHPGEHDADEIFDSWGFETSRKYTEDEIRAALSVLDSGEYGIVLRAKGYVPSEGSWIHFDFVPEETEIREGAAEVIGRICVIGSELKEDRLAELFRR